MGRGEKGFLQQERMGDIIEKMESRRGGEDQWLRRWKREEREQRRERWEKTRESRYNKYRELKGEGIPEYLGKGW